METFQIVLVVFVWVLNFGISIWNAYAVGKAWVETKHRGGWPRFMAWMGAIMSASGFTWCYLILLAFIAWAVDWLTPDQIGDWLTPDQIGVMVQLGYLILIPGVLFSGLMITLDSWAVAYRRRTLGSVGTAAYNTFAQLSNTYHAINNMGKAYRNVADYFRGGGRSNRSSDSKDGAAVLLVILLVLLALFGGILTTWAIINRVAASEGPVPTDGIEKG
jgi:hypothetical protein